MTQHINIEAILDNIQRSHDAYVACNAIGRELPAKVDDDIVLDMDAERGEKVASVFEWHRSTLNESGDITEVSFEIDCDAETMTLTYIDDAPCDLDDTYIEISEAFSNRWPELWASMIAAPEVARVELIATDAQRAHDMCCDH